MVDGRAQVVIDAVDVNDQFVNELDTTLEIIDPSTSKTTTVLPMEQNASPRYTAEFALGRYGSYMLKAVHRRNGRVVAESMGAVALSYPTEYLRTTPNLAPLKHAANVTGGFEQPTAKQAFASMHESIEYTQDLWPWILLFVAGLLVVDVYLRRVRLFGYRTIAF